MSDTDSRRADHSPNSPQETEDLDEASVAPVPGSPLPEPTSEEEPEEPDPAPYSNEEDEKDWDTQPSHASKTTALATSDPLSRYLFEIGRHPLLTREEEHQLAVRYTEEGDLEAAYKLVASNLRLVVKIANDYRRAAFNLLDLIQEGNVGLMLAVKKFDPHKGVKLSTYAAWWIRAYIIRFVMDNWRMVKLGTTQNQRKLFFNLRKEKRKLEAMGFKSEAKLLAERLDVPEQEVVDMEQRLSGAEASLQAPVGSEDGAQTLGDRLRLEGEGTDEVLADAELKSIFQEKLQRFVAMIDDPRDKLIFERRLLSEEPLTLQEIGEQFGVSRERARQVEKKLITRLKEYMEREIPDFGELVVQERD